MKDAIKTLFTWIGGIFKDEAGSPSSKRVVGIIAGVTLCITMYHNSFTTVDIAPAQYLVDAVALLAFGCLGLASVDKIFGKKVGSEEVKEEVTKK
jgi:hypothetical protein